MMQASTVPCIMNHVIADARSKQNMHKGDAVLVPFREETRTSRSGVTKTPRKATRLEHAALRIEFLLGSSDQVIWLVEQAQTVGML